VGDNFLNCLDPLRPGWIFSKPNMGAKLLQFTRARFKAQAQNLFSAMARLME
jgi:hypothetical protein